MNTSILQGIREIRRSVGTSVNEIELTELIKVKGDIVESGFRFLTLYNNFALFDVPQQDISIWYKEDGWVSEDKEQILDKIVETLGLKIVEPPDYPKLDLSTIHHHFELFSDKQKVITIHPKFLKILIPDHPIIPEQNLLNQLSSLYK
jgi:hypothetical protein